MRVLLMSRVRRDERGAVAVVVALMMIVLCICAALVTDFGMAYVNKRQAQTAADAAVLAAGRVIAGQSGSCADLTANTALMSGANAAADQLRLANLPGSPDVNLVPDCSTGSLRLDYHVNVDSPLWLGQIVTGTNHLNVDREAQVTITATPSRLVGGCSICVLGDVDAGNSDLKVIGGDISVNGTVTTGPQSFWDASTSINLTRPPNGLSQGNATPDWTIGSPIPDPLASLSLPLPTAGMVNRGNVDPCNGPGPGVYTGNITMTNGVCTLAPGAYVFTGTLAGKNNTSMRTTGATLYFPSPGGKFDLKNGAMLNFTAPSAAPRPGWPPGFAIIYDRDNANNLELQGNGDTQIDGAVYAKSATISYNGNSCFTTNGGPIVAGGITGNGTQGCVKLDNANNVGGVWQVGVAGDAQMTK